MKHCYFCTNNIRKINYKNTEILKKFTDNLARILPRKQTGTCARHQRRLAQTIKQARYLALLPFVGE